MDAFGLDLIRRIREHPLYQLTVTRLREFYREPEAVFWVYVFPLLMTVGLGIAFRTEPVTTLVVDVVRGGNIQGVTERLRTAHEQSDQPYLRAFRFRIVENDLNIALTRLRVGKTDLVIERQAAPELDQNRTIFHFDPTRKDSLLARVVAQVALYGDHTHWIGNTSDVTQSGKGGRYIDFLIPGLVGMNLLAGGLWGIGYVAVELRVRKLLKRLLATPMRKWQFLLALLLSRFIFTVTEVVLLLLFAWLFFDVSIFGSYLAVAVLLVLGGWSFSGLGLLVASRARTLEAISGLINLVTLPMWLLSGVFFSYERFPEVLHPLIRLLPLTSFNDALRGVMLEGQCLLNLSWEIGNLILWGLVSFVLALRWFRWQ